MNDKQLKDYWPPLGTLAEALRTRGWVAAADQLIDAVRGGATSSEILGNVGRVLRKHWGARRRLNKTARAAWDEVLRDVNRNNPLNRLLDFLRSILR